MDQEEQDRLCAQALQWEECNRAMLNDAEGLSTHTTNFRRFETSIYDLEEDRKFAEKLQREEENEYLAFRTEKPEKRDPQHVAEFRALIEKHKWLSLVDPQWEVIDPTPDIHAMFQVFDDMFFNSSLRFCTVSWSPRMTSCAGLCCFQKGQCSIRLSKPLLTLRPRSDLVETLLHEMIHAYIMLSGKSRSEGRDGHGPEFHKKMHRINQLAKCNITVYHSFHDEVRHYKVHHWRCDGPCRNKHPFFGWVQRSQNRAPSKNDFWWANHQRQCGGTFVKVAGPEMQEGDGSKNRKRKQPFGKIGGDVSGPLSKMLKKTMIGTRTSTSLTVSSTTTKVQSDLFQPSTLKANSSKITGLSGFTDSHINQSSQSSRNNNFFKPLISTVPKSFVPFQGTGNVLGSINTSGTSQATDQRLGHSKIPGTSKHNDHSLGRMNMAVVNDKSLSASTSKIRKTIHTPPLRQTTLDWLRSNKLGTASTLSEGTKTTKTPSFADQLRGRKLIEELFSSDEEATESDLKAGFSSAAQERPLTNLPQNAAPIVIVDRDNDSCTNISDHVANLFHEVNCPVCLKKVSEKDINTHLDACLDQ